MAAARMSRRAALRWALAGAALGRAAPVSAADWKLRRLPAATLWRQFQAAPDGTWLGIDRDGRLWQAGGAGIAPPALRGEGLSPDAALASGHGRLVALRQDGRLWVGGDAGDAGISDITMAKAAGLLVLPLAVIGVAGEGLAAQLVRLEPGGAGSWQVVARSAEPVLPDARPVQVDLDGRGDDGHLAVLAGPDRTRYAHAVLGDDIEATRVLWLERHGLKPLRVLELPAPQVFEHNQLVSWPAGQAAAGLWSVRSGAAGAQLVLIEADPADRNALRVAAAGAAIGTRNRWMSPSTDGQHIVAVHTPHLGGVLHRYRREGERLTATRLFDGLSNHAIGSHELDVSAWVEGRWVLPDLSRRRLMVVDVERGVVEAQFDLAADLRQLAAQPGTGVCACLTEDGAVQILQRARR